jgi:hypothetical protein
MQIHLNATHDYVVIKAIAMISVVAIIVDCNISLCGSNHNYCNNKKILQSANATLLLATNFNQCHIGGI